MKVTVTQTLLFQTEIEVPDEIASDKEKLRDYWVNNLVPISDVDELEWVGTNFENAETCEELGDI